MGKDRMMHQHGVGGVGHCMICMGGNESTSTSRHKEETRKQSTSIDVYLLQSQDFE